MDKNVKNVFRNGMKRTYFIMIALAICVGIFLFKLSQGFFASAEKTEEIWVNQTIENCETSFAIGYSQAMVDKGMKIDTKLLNQRRAEFRRKVLPQLLK